jgi:hypothetical protein
MTDSDGTRNQSDTREVEQPYVPHEQIGAWIETGTLNASCRVHATLTSLLQVRRGWVKCT